MFVGILDLSLHYTRGHPGLTRRRGMFVVIVPGGDLAGFDLGVTVRSGGNDLAVQLVQ